MNVYEGLFPGWDEDDVTVAKPKNPGHLTVDHHVRIGGYLLCHRQSVPRMDLLNWHWWHEVDARINTRVTCDACSLVSRVIEANKLSVPPDGTAHNDIRLTVEFWNALNKLLGA